MTTTKKEITNTFVKVASKGAWSAIQIQGSSVVELFVSESAPISTSVGLRLTVLDMILPALADEDVYAKSLKEVGSLVVIE